MSETTSQMTQVRGSLGGSSVPAVFPAEAKVYHERNFELLKIDPLWEAVEKLLASGRFLPSTVGEQQYPHGRFIIEEYRFRVLRKTWVPNPGLAWSESIVYLSSEGEKV